ncbi:MAG: hypothetical protein ACJAX5_000683 [Patiriisocius sp.]|jgi:hypothetical protein
MNITPKPQATRFTFVLLTFVMIGFGLFAEHHVESSERQFIHAHVVNAPTINIQTNLTQPTTTTTAIN